MSRDICTSIKAPEWPKDFAPSKGRSLSALAATAVAGSQPSGRALPSLLIGTPTTAAEHVRAAREVSPIAPLITVAFPTAVRNFLSAHVSDPIGTNARRIRAMETFRSVNESLEPYRGVAGTTVGSSVNFPLLLLLVRRFNYADQKIVGDLMKGMPIAGDLPECPSLAPRLKPATLSLEDWNATIPVRNKEAIDRVERARSTEIGTE